MAQLALFGTGKDVIASGVVQADVHMHAAAWRIKVGLAHEAGTVAVLHRDTPGAAAEQRRPVRRAQGIVAVGEVYLELAWAQFRRDDVRWHTLLIGAIHHFVQH